jgi:hypothetical protein
MGLHAMARVFPGGFYRVDIFFVLSAFLITTLILQELEVRSGAYDFIALRATRVEAGAGPRTLARLHSSPDGLRDRWGASDPDRNRRVAPLRRRLRGS